MVEICVGRQGRTNKWIVANIPGRVAGRRDGISLVGDIADTRDNRNWRIAGRSRNNGQEDAVLRVVERDLPSRRRCAGGSDVGHLAQRRALVEYPVMPAAGQRLIGVVVFEDRIIGNEDRTGGAFEGLRRPIARCRRLTADKAGGRERRAVSAQRPGEVLTKQCKCYCGRNRSPRSVAEIRSATLAYHAASQW